MKIVLTLFLLFISLFSWYSGVDADAIEIYNQTFDRAVYSFALAKGLNAIISVLQSSEVNFSLFVAGGTIGVGQILDPVNDLVERFSMIMLISSVSLGLQHLLLLLAKSTFLKLALLVSSFAVLLALWFKRLESSKAFVFFMRLVVLFIVLRFAAVSFVYANQFLYEQIYAKQYESSSQYISEYKSNLEVLQEDQKKLVSSLSGLEKKSELFSKKVIQIITIFVVSTIAFPLVFLWFLVFLLRLILSMKVDYDILLPMKYKGKE